MISFLIQRVIHAVIVLFVVTLIGFAVTHVLPGDPAAGILNENASPEALKKLRAEMHLDDPLPEQYARWVGGAVRLDFGQSFYQGSSVRSLIAARLVPTLELAILSFVVSFVAAIGLGVAAAANRDGPIDYVSRAVGVLGVAVPNFWLGMVLIVVVSVKFQLLPAFGYVPFSQDAIGNLQRMVLPVIAVSFTQVAVLVRMVRGTMIEALGQDYIRTARAKGLARVVILRRHALRNSLIPILTVAGLQVGRILGGAAVVETMFAIPGVGRLTVEAVQRHEYNIMQAVMLLSGVAVVGSSIVVDIAYGLLDPRIRVSRGN